MRPNWFSCGVETLLKVSFSLSILALMGWFAFYIFYPARVLEQIGDAAAMLLTAALSGAVTLLSTLLAIHYKGQEYSGGAEVVVRTCLIVSTGLLLCSGIWGLGFILLGR